MHFKLAIGDNKISLSSSYRAITNLFLSSCQKNAPEIIDVARSGKTLHESMAQNSRHAGWVLIEASSGWVQVFQIVALSTLGKIQNLSKTWNTWDLGLGIVMFVSKTSGFSPCMDLRNHLSRYLQPLHLSVFLSFKLLQSEEALQSSWNQTDVHLTIGQIVYQRQAVAVHC